MKEAKSHLQAVEEKAKQAAGTKSDTAAVLLSKLFRRASPKSVRMGQARFFMEEAVRRAERKLLERVRMALVAENDKQAEVLAEELFLTPGSLLTPKEIAHIYGESGCEEIRGPVNCSVAQIPTVNVYRTPDGTCNNLANSVQGASLTRFARILPPRYEDGINQLRGFSQSKTSAVFASGPFTPPNPSARLISVNLVADIPENQTGFTHLLMQWGQFIDHDLDLAVEAGDVECDLENCVCTDFCAPVRITQDDGVFGAGTFRDGDCHPFVRTLPSCSLANPGEFEPRQQINEITHYLDGSMVYGSTKELSDFLREFSGGRLKTGPPFPASVQSRRNRHRGRGRGRNRSRSWKYSKSSSSSSDSDTHTGTPGGASLPTVPPCPPGSPTQNCCLGSIDECFIAGDIRVNEQVSLTVMHTLWLREHNRIANRLAQLNPQWNDEHIYQTARKIVGAEIQKITLYDYLPNILGQSVFDQLIGDFVGYQPDLDASIGNGFATAAYRFGHSQIQPMFNRLNEDFDSISDGPLSLLDAFFNPQAYFDSGGTDPIMRGWITQPARRVDEFLNSILTSRLFEEDGQPGSGMDLATLNIQRGRDHGIPPYLIWKSFCSNFLNVSSDFANELTQIRFLQTYGSLDSIDLWVAGLAEEPLPGSIVGATFACIFGITFSRLRAGDRFWFENPGVFTTDQLEEIRKASIARVICDNADDIDEIQSDAFRLNPRVSCDDIPNIDLEEWEEAATSNSDLEQELARVLTDKHNQLHNKEKDDFDAQSEEIATALEKLLQSDEKVWHIRTILMPFIQKS